jgi:ADP-ribose pyrophosphatase YjhB (NUDIX family)
MHCRLIMSEKISCFTLVDDPSGFLLVEEVVDGRQVFSAPGGTYEPDRDASLEDCAVREAKEESGLDIAVRGLIDWQISEKKDGSITNRLYLLGDVTGGELIEPTKTKSANFYVPEDIGLLNKAGVLRGNGLHRAFFNYQMRGAYDINCLNQITIEAPRKSKRRDEDQRLKAFV